MHFKEKATTGLALAALCGLGTAVPASAAPGASSWTETNLGSVQVASAQAAGPGITWVAGAQVTTDQATGATRFAPVLFQQDRAEGETWQRLPVSFAGWDSRSNDLDVTPDGSAYLVGDMSGTDPGVLVGRYVAGRWNVSADTALPAGTTDASLLSVSGTSAHEAWAVGQADDATGQVPLVQHWNGHAWQLVRIPIAGYDQWLLTQVKEVSPNDVWVVGNDNATGQTLAAHWDGTAWRRIPTPAFPDSSVLFDIAARTPSDIWAVGWYRDTDKQRPLGLALHWDGRSWTQLPLPAGTFALNSVALQPAGGIAVVGGNDDAAVGLTWDPAGGWKSLDLPENNPDQPLGAWTVLAQPGRLTVTGWHYLSSDFGDTFESGVILTR